MGVLADYLPDYTQLRDFYINTYEEYIPPMEIWYVSSDSEYAVKDKLTVKGKIVVEGKLIIET